RQHEPDWRPARRGQPARYRPLKLGPQPEQARLGRDKVRAKFFAPRRMGEIAGPDEGDPFSPGLPGQVLQIAVPTAGTRVPRVNVQVRVKAHSIIIPNGRFLRPGLSAFSPRRVKAFRP